LKEIKGTVVSARKQTSTAYDSLNINGAAIDIAKACGDNSNISTANGTLYSIGLDLSTIEGSITAAIDLLDCSSVSPILRQLQFGSTCTDSVGGLAWLYSMLISITILGFVVLATRAALYNPVIRGRRNKRREKEFENYKEYMSEFYDTSDWEIHCIPDVSTNDTDESECYRIDGTNSQATYSDNHEDVDQIACDSVDKTQSISITQKPSPIIETKQERKSPDNMENSTRDDDDDSYDSTYSVEIGEEQSVSSSSVFSMFMKRRIQSLHQLEKNKVDTVRSHDEIMSNMSSSSSMLKRFMVRKSRIGNIPLDGKDPLSIHPVSASLHHPYDHRINSHDDDDDEASSEENDENDSNAGVLLTPQALKHPLQHLNISMLSSQRRRESILETMSQDNLDELSTSPLALELQPLSPSSFMSPNVGQKRNSPSFRESEHKKYPKKSFRWPIFRNNNN
jgi:hypothetical protein